MKTASIIIAAAALVACSTKPSQQMASQAELVSPDGKHGILGNFGFLFGNRRLTELLEQVAVVSGKTSVFFFQPLVLGNQSDNLIFHLFFAVRDCSAFGFFQCVAVICFGISLGNDFVALGSCFAYFLLRLVEFFSCRRVCLRQSL